jgi:hypothetical protein
VFVAGTIAAVHVVVVVRFRVHHADDCSSATQMLTCGSCTLHIQVARRDATGKPLVVKDPAVVNTDISKDHGLFM